ncbi:UNVERIFIED_CONTAM: hypothetical protein Sradi_4667200 [Sesamum radiatum]|uniref:Uncharacterized protein n=1 Tax=Sesamum radiatum TaxID=300843 RepID=A0AAW2MVH0_SESRA
MGAHRNSPFESPKVDIEVRSMGAHRNSPKESPKVGREGRSIGSHRNSPKEPPKVDREGRSMGAHRNSPKESPKQKSTTLRFLLDLDSKYDSGRTPHSKSTNEGILSLISYCTYTYTFTDPSESPSQQNLKRDQLLELLSTIKSLKNHC